MTTHEIQTSLSPAEVIERARSFFALAGTPYTAFAKQAGKGYLKLHIDAGEIVIGAMQQADSTQVRGSCSRGAHLLTRFLATLAPPLDASQTTQRHGLHEPRAALSETFTESAAISLVSQLESSVQPATRVA